MPVVAVGTLIARKPVTITTSRSITIICRIDAHLVKGQNRPESGNITGIGQAVLVVPLSSDVNMGDTFYYNGLLYEVNSKIPEANLGGVEQYGLIVRE